MEVKNGSDVPFGKELPRELYGHLAPIEHVMIGSSIREGSQMLDSQAILARGPQYFLRPLDLTDANHDTIETERTGTYLQGYLPVFAIDRDLIRGGYEQRVWLPGMDLEGRITPHFKIQLIHRSLTGEPVDTIRREELQAVVDKLKVHSTFEEFFELDKSKAPEENIFLLSIKSSQPV